jgi:hypothetical protein
MPENGIDTHYNGMMKGYKAIHASFNGMQTH